MFEEVGQPYETVLREFGPKLESADDLSINPMGKVAALKPGNTVVTEAPAICAYLGDRINEAFMQAAEAC